MEYHIDITEKRKERAEGYIECDLWDYFEQLPERIIDGAWDCSILIEWTAEKHLEEWRIFLERYSLHGDTIEQIPNPRLPFVPPRDMLESIRLRLKEDSDP